jgi:hypothetical protein
MEINPVTNRLSFHQSNVDILQNLNIEHYSAIILHSNCNLFEI